MLYSCRVDKEFAEKSSWTESGEVAGCSKVSGIFQSVIEKDIMDLLNEFRFKW